MSRLHRTFICIQNEQGRMYCPLCGERELQPREQRWETYRFPRVEEWLLMSPGWSICVVCATDVSALSHSEADIFDFEQKSGKEIGPLEAWRYEQFARYAASCTILKKENFS